MHSIAEIRALYPNPTNLFSMDQETYCVGGALCRFFRLPLSDNFPELDALATALTVINSSLDRAHAITYALDIICANDSGDFAAAWTSAERALEDHA